MSRHAKEKKEAPGIALHPNPASMTGIPHWKRHGGRGVRLTPITFTCPVCAGNLELYRTHRNNYNADCADCDFSKKVADKEASRVLDILNAPPYQTLPLVMRSKDPCWTPLRKQYLRLFERTPLIKSDLFVQLDGAVFLCPECDHHSVVLVKKGMAYSYHCTYCNFTTDITAKNGRYAIERVFGVATKPDTTTDTVTDDKQDKQDTQDGPSDGEA